MGITQIEIGDHAREVYMPYAMSTILDRALPDIRDGLKPIHRRILYAMYKAGITYNKDRAKTTEPISATMKIHHHGDSSISDAIALMTEQNENLLHPYIDGEGAFGKVYSKDKPSAPRYTYCRLNRFTEEYFKDLEDNVLQMIGEDKDHLQPVVLSSSFPSILIKNNEGIGCGEACLFFSFNLAEVCDTTIKYIEDKNINLLDTLLSPDFSTGGYILYSKSDLEKIYNTGQGSIRLRAKYRYDKDNNCIDIYEIPYSTTVDAIITKVSDLMKQGKLKDVTDIREETGYNIITKKEEMKITIDIKRNINVDVLMANLFKNTPLETSCSANMNCLVNYEPKVLGIKAILDEWLIFRRECINKSTQNNIDKKSKQLHILKGLEKVLLDIDEAIQIIRHSKSDELIITNLMNKFNIDEMQANEISNMKLRNINQQYILNKIKSIQELEKEVNDLKSVLNNEDKINDIIIQQLQEVKSKYGKPRMTEILYEHEIDEISTDQLIEDYNTKLILTQENYLKKIPATSMRGSANIKLKEGDTITSELDSTNKSDILLFSNKQVCYKLYAWQLEDTKPSNLGIYLPQELQLDSDEKIIQIISTTDYQGYLVFAFTNGKIAKIDLSSYSTKTQRSKLLNAYANESELINMFYIKENIDILCKSSINKVLITNTSLINSKSSKNSQGNMTLKSKNDSYMDMCVPINNIQGIEDIEYYRGKTNAVGSYLKKTDSISMIKLT